MSASKSLGDLQPELRRPFTAAAIKAKPQATTGEGAAMKGLVSFYIDARLAAERLNAVVGLDGWTDAYDVLIRDQSAVSVGIPVECHLTLLGVTKSDVGQIAPGNVDDKAWKSAYSDAFKRAAVKFGIGAYLYGGPAVWVEVKVGRNGKAQGFTPAGVAAARAAYGRWIAETRMVDLFGLPLDHGDVEELHGADGPSVQEPGEPSADKPADRPQPSSAAVARADEEDVEPASPDEETFAEKAARAQAAGPKATKPQLAEIASLVDVCAVGRGTTADKVWAALANDGYRLEELRRSQAEELIAKLNRWAGALEAA